LIKFDGIIRLVKNEEMQSKCHHKRTGFRKELIRKLKYLD